MSLTAEPVSDKVGDAIVDAGDMFLDLAFGSPDGRSLSGRRVLRVALLLLIVGAVVGGVVWRQRAATPPVPDPTTSD